MSEEFQTGRLIPYLVETFRYQAWIAMGKVANPVTERVEREMAVARIMIDMLAELDTRTEGKRSPDENRLLQGALTDLRLNYLDEMKKSPERAAAAGPKAPGAPAEASEAGAGDSQSSETERS